MGGVQSQVPGTSQRLRMECFVNITQGYEKAQDEDERVKLFHSEIGRNAHTANDMFGLEVSACVPKQIKRILTKILPRKMSTIRF